CLLVYSQEVTSLIKICRLLVKQGDFLSRWISSFRIPSINLQQKLLLLRPVSIIVSTYLIDVFYLKYLQYYSTSFPILLVFVHCTILGLLVHRHSLSSSST